MTVEEVRQSIEDAIMFLEVPIDPAILNAIERTAAVFRSYGYDTALVDAGVRLAKIPPPIDCLRRLEWHPLLLRLIGRFS
jgi:hypothetical protein